MKKPFLNQFERLLIDQKTLSGAFLMVNFRFHQFIKAMIKGLKL